MNPEASSHASIREAQLLQQRLEAWLRAQGIERLVEPEHAQELRIRGVRLFQSVQSSLAIPETQIHESEIERRRRPAHGQFSRLVGHEFPSAFGP